MPYGLHKLSGAANKMAALDDYRRACVFVPEQGREDAVIPLPAKAGHKRIDRISRAIILALNDVTAYAAFPDLFAEELRRVDLAK